MRDVRTTRDLDDDIKWVKFSGASWTLDGQGFYYSRYDEPTDATRMTGVNYFQKLYYHRLGTPQSQDRLVYQRADHKDWGFDGEVTDDGNYLIITSTEGTDPRKRVFYQSLAQPGAPVVELLTNFDADYSFVDNDGPLFWFYTDLKAPRGRVIGIDIRRPDRANWREIIPQAAETLKGVSTLNNSFVCQYLKDARSEVKVFSLDGRISARNRNAGDRVRRRLRGQTQRHRNLLFLHEFHHAGNHLPLRPQAAASSVFRAPKSEFNPADYETKQVFYPSKDGTPRAHVHHASKKGLKLDGTPRRCSTATADLTSASRPRFSVGKLVWMEMGGVYAVPNMRGGGEYGEAWHQAGTKLHKQNVFDDFIAAGRMADCQPLHSDAEAGDPGGSNGGLLVGACDNPATRPLWRGLAGRRRHGHAALPQIHHRLGVDERLRLAARTREEFAALYKYSPLHNIRPGRQYPATLIMTADHDDRVVPAHSFKFAATMQAAQAGPAPVLIRIETKAGHGAGKPTSKQIDEAADRWAFLVRELKMKVPEDF